MELELENIWILNLTAERKRPRHSAKIMFEEILKPLILTLFLRRKGILTYNL